MVSWGRIDKLTSIGRGPIGIRGSPVIINGRSVDSKATLPVDGNPKGFRDWIEIGERENDGAS